MVLVWFGVWVLVRGWGGWGLGVGGAGFWRGWVAWGLKRCVVCLVFADVAWLGSSLGFDFLKIFIGVTLVLVCGCWVWWLLGVGVWWLWVLGVGVWWLVWFVGVGVGGCWMLGLVVVGFGGCWV